MRMRRWDGDHVRGIAHAAGYIPPPPTRPGVAQTRLAVSFIAGLA